MSDKLEDIKEKEIIRSMRHRAKKSKLLLTFYKISMSKSFNYFLQAVIVANTLVLCFDRYPIP